MPKLYRSFHFVYMIILVTGIYIGADFLLWSMAAKMQSFKQHSAYVLLFSSLHIRVKPIHITTMLPPSPPHRTIHKTLWFLIEAVAT